MNKKINIILGSSSARRKSFFSLLFEDFFIIEPNCEEIIYNSPIKTVLINSKNKLKAILNNNYYIENFCDYNKNSYNLIVTADTIVYKSHKIFPKPNSSDEAFLMLKDLNGKKHSVYTGVAIFFAGNTYYFYEKTDVYFNLLPENILKNYINTLEPFDAAGSYKIQGSGSLLVKKIKGSLTNVIGFPVEKFLKYYNRFICYSKEEVSIVSITY